jgi:hypothetical protein
MHYMILMSEKMMSQKKLGEINSVPYNEPLYAERGQSQLSNGIRVWGLRTESS